MYVTQLPEASTHPKYMSQKDETRGTADSIRAANYLKRWAILYRWEKRIKLKEEDSRAAACSIYAARWIERRLASHSLPHLFRHSHNRFCPLVFDHTGVDLFHAYLAYAMTKFSF